MTGRRTQGTGSVQEIAPGKWRLRIFVGTDEKTGNPRQKERTVKVDGRREAERLFSEFRQECIEDLPEFSRVVHPLNVEQLNRPRLNRKTSRPKNATGDSVSTAWTLKRS